MSRGPDALIVEEPLAIDLDGTLVATTMRTPGNDFELAVGYCFTDGLLGGAPVTSCRYCGTGSAVETEFNAVTRRDRRPGADADAPADAHDVQLWAVWVGHAGRPQGAPRSAAGG